MWPSSGAIGLAAGLYATRVAADLASYTVGESEDIKFRWGVPEAAASSGSGNLFFQLEAPTSYAWVGLGIGSGMVGADMFIMYQDGAGNVTLSTRKGEAYAMPHHVERNDVTLLAGSGVEGDKMVANVQCSGCDTLNLGGSNGWISSWSTGDAIDSTDPDAMIFMHVGRTTFDLDFAQANIQADENPFVDEQGNTPPPSNNEGEDNNSAVTEQEDSGVDRGMIHGIIMTIVFVFLYPMGSLLMILTRKWWLHGIWQTVSFLLMWGGFASGYMAAKQGNLYFTEAHTRIGTIVCALLGIQPFLGYAHHLLYKKYQRRTAVSHIHIWYGRVLLVFGIINGGLGLRLAMDTTGSFVIAYSVVAAITGVAYLVGIGYGEVRKRRTVVREKTPPMTHENSA
jgi:hypothetical protein